jgi:hypothetical protein
MNLQVIFLSCLLIFSLALDSCAQCNPVFDSPLSSRLANYIIDLNYFHEEQKVDAKQQLTWINHSPDTIDHLRFYMYLNAFKNTESTYIKEAKGVVFGQSLDDRTEGTWGWIKVKRAMQGEMNIAIDQEYIQPDDGNVMDQSVLLLPLDNYILPGDTLVLDMEFEAKLPKTISRAGYSRDDFALWVHWFPQIGVYEQNDLGEWGWNCHQFRQRTEFYAEFGTYDVSITCADHLILGASGCELSNEKISDNKKKVRYRVEDVIDFAWTAYPHFCQHEDRWEHVNIRLLIPPEHDKMADRYIRAVKQSLEYLTEHVGYYPYRSITIMDPPLHGLRSGLMEYPTFITGGCFYGLPSSMRSLESLAIHEFAHQYFMGMVATNEKEEPWLDEGFVTYYEDRILDHYYGVKSAYYDVLGYRTGNTEKSRSEYTGLPNPKIGSIGRPGWEITESYKGLVYAKTATILSTIQALVGDELMDEMMSGYFNKFKFTHPRGEDFFAWVQEFLAVKKGNEYSDLIMEFLQEGIHGTSICDYSIRSISNIKSKSNSGLFDSEEELEYRVGSISEAYYSEVTVQREGEWYFPTEILIEFEDGSKIVENWDGGDIAHTFIYEGTSPVISAHIDPNYTLKVDLDFNNNSFTYNPTKASLWKYSFKAIAWVQNILQSVSWFV